MGHEWSTGGLVFARCVRCGARHATFEKAEVPCIGVLWDALIAEASRR